MIRFLSCHTVIRHIHTSHTRSSSTILLALPSPSLAKDPFRYGKHHRQFAPQKPSSVLKMFQVPQPYPPMLLLHMIITPIRALENLQTNPTEMRATPARDVITTICFLNRRLTLWTTFDPDFLHQLDCSLITTRRFVFKFRACLVFVGLLA